MNAWAKLPTRWILESVILQQIEWRIYKSDGIASLLIIIALSIKRNIDQKISKSYTNSPVVCATYDNIQELIGLSRAKIANGLKLLVSLGVIRKHDNARSYYDISSIDEPGGWCQLPQAILMPKDRISRFDEFKLRSKNELYALKLYMILLAIRNTKTGYANIGYEKISDYTGIPQKYLKRAKSHLINLELIDVEQDKATDSRRPPLRYKIRGLS